MIPGRAGMDPKPRTFLPPKESKELLVTLAQRREGDGKGGADRQLDSLSPMGPQEQGAQPPPWGYPESPSDLKPQAVLLSQHQLRGCSYSVPSPLEGLQGSPHLSL